MANGGSISHHHGINIIKFFIIKGVGKLRKKFLEDSIGKNGIKMISSVK